MPFTPYLFFTGNCREAFTRYQEIFGGDLTLLTMNDVPSDGDEPPVERGDMIIHAALKVGDDLLMASDDPTTDQPRSEVGHHGQRQPGRRERGQAGVRCAGRRWRGPPGTDRRRSSRRRSACASTASASRG